jgi:hypothetical protein
MSFVRVAPKDGSLMARRLAAWPRLSLVQEPNTLSKSVDVRSREVSGVCDLELRPGPVIRGCPRTAANETRTETGAASVPKGFQEHARFVVHHGFYLDVQHLDPPRRPRSSRVYPAPVARDY